MRPSPLTQDIKIGLLGYGGLLRLSQDHMVAWLASQPVVFYDRAAIQAEARTFFFFCLSAQHPQSDRVYPRCAILQQGMHNYECFGKVYCDRVYFWCAKGFDTGSGFDRRPPPPPPRLMRICDSQTVRHFTSPSLIYYGKKLLAVRGLDLPTFGSRRQSSALPIRHEQGVA